MDEEGAVAGGCLGCITGHRAVLVQPVHHCCLLMVRMQISPERV